MNEMEKEKRSGGAKGRAAGWGDVARESGKGNGWKEWSIFPAVCGVEGQRYERLGWEGEEEMGAGATALKFG